MILNITEFIRKINSLSESTEPIVVKKRGKEVFLAVPLKEEVKRDYPELYALAKTISLAEFAKKDNIPLEDVIAQLRRQVKKTNGSRE